MPRKVVVVDIDGTISKVGNRIKYLQQEPKDWDAFYADCFDDEPIHEIIELVDCLWKQRYGIVFCTGRRESCRDNTVSWINKYFSNNMKCKLLMRSNGDHRHDMDVKPDLLAMHGFHQSHVAFILEDRNSMVKKWRELGFTCLQVAEGDF